MVTVSQAITEGIQTRKYGLFLSPNEHGVVLGYKDRNGVAHDIDHISFRSPEDYSRFQDDIMRSQEGGEEIVEGIIDALIEKTRVKWDGK